MATQTKIQNYFNKRPVPRVTVKISSFLRPVDESEKDDENDKEDDPFA